MFELLKPWRQLNSDTRAVTAMEYALKPTFRTDPELCDALLKVARHEDSRKCFILLAEILDTPGLADRLLQVLKERSA